MTFSVRKQGNFNAQLDELFKQDIYWDENLKVDEKRLRISVRKIYQGRRYEFLNGLSMSYFRLMFYFLLGSVEGNWHHDVKIMHVRFIEMKWVE